MAPRITAIHRFMWKNKEGLMIIRAFVHLIKVGPQPFAAGQGVSALGQTHTKRRETRII